ncbi:hypothetical protein Poli38472_008100 [Pythium oligandrum]|uniref:Uncharacterized protein n=1 Tax=Pythium oligandrum TaxID=41045 RepID=A0A8K1FPB9_PYTOL|nr:hypothetical protein Poli38472_008100 [Pythium oligandrum]|eukprot:TMW65458.1 hypothetical protein Poli38472_008100 [Pythium oligandrum]
MTITSRVHTAFFASTETSEAQLIRLPPTVIEQYARMKTESSRPRRRRGAPRANLWTAEEHDRFLQGLERYPKGPWKLIATMVGTKTTRQTMTHAQKYRQKIERRQRLDDVSPTRIGEQQDASNQVSFEENDTAVLMEQWEQMQAASKNAALGMSYEELLILDPVSVSIPSEAAMMYQANSPFDIACVEDLAFFDPDLVGLLTSLEPLPLVV